MALIWLFCTVLIQLNLRVGTHSLPIVDPGLFVIHGVSTCGQSQGYCLLSNSCKVDSDFERDTNGGHCDGLKNGFQPNAHFVCCQAKRAPTEPPPAEPPPADLDTTITPEPTTPVPSEDPGPTEVDPAADPVQVRDSPGLVNAVAYTNQILNELSAIWQGARVPPNANLWPRDPDQNEDQLDDSFENDKSLLHLILMGLNVSLTTERSLPD